MNTETYKYLVSNDMYEPRRQNVTLIDEGCEVNVGYLIFENETETKAITPKGTSYTLENHFSAIDLLIAKYFSSPARARKEAANKNQISLF